MTPYVILAAAALYLLIGAVCARRVFLHAWRRGEYGNGKPPANPLMGTEFRPEPAAQRRTVHEDMLLWGTLWPILGAAAVGAWLISNTLARPPRSKQKESK